MPVDGDDGFYPTGNELVLFYIGILAKIYPGSWTIYPLHGKEKNLYRNPKS
jgi:hypothetical protein